MQQSRTKARGKQKQPLMCAAFPCPIEFPLIVGAQKIVFHISVRTCLLQNEIQVHMPWGIGMVVRVITDLYAIERVLTAQDVAERDSLSANAQERESQITQIRFARR